MRFALRMLALGLYSGVVAALLMFLGLATLTLLQHGGFVDEHTYATCSRSLSVGVPIGVNLWLFRQWGIL